MTRPSDYRTAFAFSSVPLPAIPTAHLATCLPHARQNVGFTMFRLNNADDLAPAYYTGSRLIRVPAY